MPTLRAKKDAVDITVDTSLHAQLRRPKLSAIERSLKIGPETMLFVCRSLFNGVRGVVQPRGGCCLMMCGGAKIKKKFAGGFLQTELTPFRGHSVS